MKKIEDLERNELIELATSIRHIKAVRNFKRIRGEMSVMHNPHTDDKVQYGKTHI